MSNDYHEHPPRRRRSCDLALPSDWASFRAEFRLPSQSPSESPDNRQRAGEILRNSGGPVPPNPKPTQETNHVPN